MQLRARLGAWLSTAIIASVLFGCTVVDQYSGRAIVYNLEAEQAQDQAMLLNIVRAYLRRPMQFTTVSTITGIASASGSVQYTLPTNVPFRPATQGATGIAAFPPLPTWLFGGSMSGGPAFTVPVLDTQEFYQGILKAIPGQIWDLYIQANYPPDLLFNLFVQRVVVRHADLKPADRCKPDDHTDRCEFVFYNYVGVDIQIDLFQALADYLLALGLTTEQPEAPTVPFVKPQSINVRYVGNPSPKKPDEAQVIGPPGGGSAPSEAQPLARPYKLCFAPRYGAKYVTASRCGQKATDKSVIQSSGLATVNVTASDRFVQTLMEIAATGHPPEVATKVKRQLESFFDCNRFDICGRFDMEITIYMRSTEGMIYYLGEVVRRALHPDLEPEEKRYIFVKRSSPYVPYPLERCTKPSRTCNYVFRLQESTTPAPDGFVSIQFDGRWYSLSGSYDPDQPDLSTMTLEFLKQQIALNSSAKSLPQSSVITTVGGP